jgi:hypothetical protein
LQPHGTGPAWLRFPLAGMEHCSKNNGWQTFLEHWGLLLFAVAGLAASQLILFFTRLTGAAWIWMFVASFVLMSVGGGLIVYAKLPVFRSGRFKFGLKSVPEHLVGRYRWGWRVFLFGVILSLWALTVMAV